MQIRHPYEYFWQFYIIVNRVISLIVAAWCSLTILQHTFGILPHNKAMAASINGAFFPFETLYSFMVMPCCKNQIYLIVKAAFI